ncbi:alpha/beta hydrolase family protein [Actinomadura bangladeshensis]|uniref:Alpha/beta fold hydrolase n=1 Tax=Actinomadura bangladeshensis TaxID=453573 RepID=A0A4R4P6I7_9ACTN|nr:alpha/beta fold hydrolase [Actinomadura bangladeshensis]TDC16443.1 alpha/beta fold hydrolase [Actinomadura bangladeshensis]
MTNNYVQLARSIPVPEAVPTVSVNPVTLRAPDRGLPLELRVTAPLHGGALPIVLLSHGGGSSHYLKSKDGYSPLVDFYASHGFAVIQPTHLSSPSGGLGLDKDAPGYPLFWRSRIDDFGLILDNLNAIEAQAPVVAGRLDPARIAAVGHSAGGNTVSALLGARATDPAGGTVLDLREPRIIAGVLLASTGSAEGMTNTMREQYPELETDFSHLTTRTLVVYGDQDGNPVATTRGADWHAEPYHLSPGADALLTLPGAKHYLGGIMGYSLAETDDEDPERLAVTQRMTWAYLRSALHAGDPAWQQATDAIRGDPSLGRVHTK